MYFSLCLYICLFKVFFGATLSAYLHRDKHLLIFDLCYSTYIPRLTDLNRVICGSICPKPTMFLLLYLYICLFKLFFSVKCDMDCRTWMYVNLPKDNG